MILVTGGTGFIGSHLAERLLADGEQVRALIRPSSSLRNLPPVDVETRLEEALAGVTAVIHLAGATKALRAADYYDANVRVTERLARAIAGRGIRLVHVSSLAAVGPTTQGNALTEDATPHPFTAYGKSKLVAEKVVRALLPDAVIVRPPVVYGPRDTGVFQMLKAISRGWALEIAGGERWFSAIYVRDLVDGLIAAARSPAAAGRTYFLSHSIPVSWSDLVTAAARVIGRRPHVLRIPVSAAQLIGFGAEIWAWATRKPGILSREKVAEARCPAWICDPHRAATELSFEAPTSLEKGLAETLAWYKEVGWLRY
jgi:nucleoside-diphosphate-sugar epimerase